jgi:raffinose/stachyose/melibiose transport system substrate-binding protein
MSNVRVAAGRLARSSAPVVVGALLVLTAAFPGAAGSAQGDQVTITMLANTLDQTAWQVLIANFERAYPNVTVSATYIPGSTLGQLETTELGAGNAPDLLPTNLGCGTTTSICELAKNGQLAPMLKVPWAKRSRSLPLVTSLSKQGGALLAFEPGVTFAGMFTNDDLFRKLGLKVPQTFSQLLAVCRKATADGTVAVFVPGTASATVQLFLEGFAIPYVYASDRH